jgi:hypothetical protein
MGRSISTHRNAFATFYTQFECEDEEDSSYEWENFVDYIREMLSNKYKSLSNVDRWVDREDHVILENSVAEISISEYCGGVAICLAPRDTDNPLHEGWCGQICQGFHKLLNKHFQGYVKIGSMSNGEGVYQMVG